MIERKYATADLERQPHRPFKAAMSLRRIVTVDQNKRSKRKFSTKFVLCRLIIIY